MASAASGGCVGYHTCVDAPGEIGVPDVPESAPARGSRVAAAVVSGLVVAALVGLVLARAGGGATGWAAAVVAANGFALPWLVLAALGVAVPLALAPGALRVTRVAAAALTLTWVAVWGRAWVSWPDRGEGRALRVLSWNVQGLNGVPEDASGVKATRCVVNVIEASVPDVVVLLEVGDRALARLSEAAGLTCQQEEYLRHSRSGLAVCARGTRWQIGSTWKQEVRPGSYRYVGAEVSDGQGTVNVLGVHLTPYRDVVGAPERLARVPVVQRREAEALAATVDGFRDATVLAGDFNSPRDAPLHARLRRSMKDALEVAGWGPAFTARRAIPLAPADARGVYAVLARAADALGVRVPARVDYVYASERVRVREADVADVACADHLPVRVALRVPANGK